MTSRMVSLPVSIMTQRSMPIPIPPVGGMPMLLDLKDLVLQVLLR